MTLITESELRVPLSELPDVDGLPPATGADTAAAELAAGAEDCGAAEFEAAAATEETATSVRTEADDTGVAREEPASVEADETTDALPPAGTEAGKLDGMQIRSSSQSHTLRYS